MFKLVVLSVLVAIAAAKPSYSHGYSAIVEPAIAHTAIISGPAAVSSSFRKQVINEPILSVHASPAVVATEEIVAVPLIKEAVEPVKIPAAVSSTYRKDIISKPIVATYAAPIVKEVVAAPLVREVIAPVAVHDAASHTFRKDIISKPIISTYATSDLVASGPAVVAPAPIAPLAQGILSPISSSAVSSTYRKDLISEPIVAYQAAPVVTKTVITNPDYSYSAHVPALKVW